MVDAFKNFMSAMTDTIMQQVSKQVQTAVEAVSTARPLPHFEYVPTTGCEPSLRHDPMVSHRHSEGMREAPHVNRDKRSRGENRDPPNIVTVQAMDGRQSQPRPRRCMQRLPDEPLGLRSKSKPRGLDLKPLNDDRPQSIVLTANACEVPLGRRMACVDPPRRLNSEEPRKFSRLNKESNYSTHYRVRRGTRPTLYISAQ
ncbi:hypothetical protein Cgig2_007784 [Carnegiea gigantea]|uniref:Uncharacterized protein n=1 Tax=Carnegiea gigantea TaxID=171969 RepID=A0A9Q1QAL5_9CARY|nr:hypothetical protein Cgig2_007784 [Carnegiea gigantea]